MDDKLKGDLAEMIVQYMFQKSGRKIFPIGIERRNDKFFDYFQKKKSCENPSERPGYNADIRKIFSIPDFVIENVIGDFELVEVKFRSLNDFIREMERLNSKNSKLFDLWSSAAVILVSKEPLDETGYFTVLRRSFSNHEGVTYCIGESFGTILDEKGWGIDPIVFGECEEMVKKIYS
jgi:hypothetical protein